MIIKNILLLLSSYVHSSYQLLSLIAINHILFKFNIKYAIVIDIIFILNSNWNYFIVQNI